MHFQSYLQAAFFLQRQVTSRPVGCTGNFEFRPRSIEAIQRLQGRSGFRTLHGCCLALTWTLHFENHQ
jgi:hypothetical protein